MDKIVLVDDTCYVSIEDVMEETTVTQEEEIINPEIPNVESLKKTVQEIPEVEESKEKIVSEISEEALDEKIVSGISEEALDEKIVSEISEVTLDEKIVSEIATVETENKMVSEISKVEPEEKIFSEISEEEPEQKQSEISKEEPDEQVVSEIVKVESENAEHVVVPQVSAYARAAAEEVKSTLAGKWRLDRSVNYEDFLREIGINFLFRKAAAKSKPTQLIVVDLKNASIKISTFTGVWSNEGSYRVGEEYEKEVNNVKFKGIVKWEDGHLIMEQNPCGTTSTAKKQVIHRERIEDELVITIYTGRVVCKRYFKRLGE